MRDKRGFSAVARIGIWTVLGLALLLVAIQAGASIPKKIAYQGRLVDSGGNPMAGDHTVLFSLHNAESGGIMVWSETQTVTADSNGVFAAILGDNTPIQNSFADPKWLSITVDGQPLSPRREIVSVASAFNAQNADSLGGLAAGSYAPVSHTHYYLSAADGNPVNPLYVNADGRVGIGTTGPLTDLDISRNVDDLTGIGITNITAGGSSSEALLFRNEDGEVAGLRLYDDNSIYSDAMILYNNRPSGNIRFATGDTVRMRIDHQGRVGVGVDSPTEELQVAGTIRVDGTGTPLKLFANASAYIDFRSTSTSPIGLRLETANRAWYLINGLGGSDVMGLYGPAGPAGYERAFVIDGPTHKVGIGTGTNTPTSRLDISNGTGYNQFRMRTSYTPTSTTDPNGAVGDMAWDDDYIYVKTSAGWKRAALSVWGL
jgi:hypothetical protein